MVHFVRAVFFTDSGPCQMVVEKSQFDDLTFARIDFSQDIERTVHGQHLGMRLRRNNGDNFSEISKGITRSCRTSIRALLRSFFATFIAGRHNCRNIAISNNVGREAIFQQLLRNLRLFTL